jgi:hypothetical protein
MYASCLEQLALDLPLKYLGNNVDWVDFNRYLAKEQNVSPQSRAKDIVIAQFIESCGVLYLKNKV